MKIIFMIIAFLLIIGCAKQPTELNEFQITACESADEGNTCETKLPELNIVRPEECCNVLGKCC